MNRLYLRNTFFVLTFLITLSSAVMNQSGPGGALTNAPGESNCTSCHSGALVTSGTNFNNIFLTTGFQGGGYVPDSTYTISLSFKQAGISRYGFQITALTSSGNLPVGTFTAGNSRVQKYSVTISGNSRQYIGQTNTGSDTVKKDSTRWVFTWKAPSSNVGKIKFYAIVNATNSNSSDNGDVCYAKTFEYGMSPLMPVADATSIDSVTCTNYNAQMTGKGSNSPLSYSWKFINATPTTSTLQNPVVKFTVPGTQLAILTVKNALGTSQPDTLKVIVKSTPSASILNGAGGTICKGDSIQISANTGLSLTYLWNPTNKTTRQIFLKDTGNYNVTVKSTTTLCSATSSNYKLSWYIKPTIAITKTLTNDTFCGQINETFTATGTPIDSVHWYVNNKLTARTKGLSYTINSSTNSSIYAIGKSINGCYSLASNTYNLKVTPKIFPANFTNTKSTDTIGIKWNKVSGIDSIKYSLNNINFFKTTTDTSLFLKGLQPSTFYNIKIRSYQKGICKFTDTVLSIRTNNCSNLAYSIVMNSRVCKGDTINVLVKNIRKTKVGISFDYQPYSNDTTFFFIPLKNDSLSIRIIDSLSLTCPPILENQAYLVDTFPEDLAIYTFNASSCVNTFTHSISPLYQKYEFFKNNVKVYSGTNNQYNHTGLITGDKLTARVFINTCSKGLGPVTFTLSPPSVATFTYARNWKTYTFKPNDTNNVNYAWYLNDTLISNSQNLVKDMTAYNKKTVNLKLKTVNFSTCSDSSQQIINFPDFLTVANINNYMLNIYPNPFTDQVEINTNLNGYKLDVYDNLGRHLVDLSGLNEHFLLNTIDWQSGLYHIVISNEQLKLDRVLIKLK